MYHPPLHLHAMPKDDFTVLRSGFDTLELAYSAALPEPFLDVLEAAKQQAAKSRRAEPASYRDVEFLVEASGAQGGYAYRVSTGMFGAIWTFRDKSSRDPWTTHVKLRAHGLAIKGLEKAKADCDDFLKQVGSVFDGNDARVSRADFAIDVFYPAFAIRTSEFVTHARTLHAEIIDRRGNSETCNYARFGKLPGKQICTYNKSQKVNQEKDLVWQDIFSAKLFEKLGINSSGKIDGIWRFEIRAGRDFLSDQIGIRRWDKFFASLPAIFLPILASISWRVPRNDINRARWPVQPVWTALTKVVEQETGSDLGCTVSPETLLRLRSEYVALLDAQLAGLVLSRAATDHVEVDGLSKFASKLISGAQNRLAERPDLIGDLAVRARRIEMLFGSP